MARMLYFRPSRRGFEADSRVDESVGRIMLKVFTYVYAKAAISALDRHHCSL